MNNPATQVGIVIAVLTIGGMLVGKLIDSIYGSSPFGILSGIFLGVTSASVFLVVKFRAIIKNEEQVYNKNGDKKGGDHMEKCEVCGHEHEGPCDCGCTVVKCDKCGHMHGDAPCSCGCGKE